MAPRKVGFRQRARYWFDNTMSRGTVGLIGWLAIASAVLIVTITIGLSLVEGHATRADGSPPPTALQLLWQTFVTTFSLAVPTDESAVPVLALWFVLALGGIFVVSALVGLLTSGLHRKLDQLRKGRSPVVEKGHTVILGWSDQAYAGHRPGDRVGARLRAPHVIVDLAAPAP